VTVDELLRSIWRRRALFGAVLFAALAAIVAVTFALERRYESTATLYVGPPLTEEGPATLDVNVGEQLSRTYSTLASNPNVAEAVLGRLDLDLTRDELLDRMGFAPVERTQLLQISAQAESRELAQRIAQTYATVFVERIADRVRRGAAPSRVSISEPAARPSDPVAPRPALYIGLGSLVALLLAAAVAVVRDRLDHGVQIPQAASEAFGRPILARVPEIRGSAEASAAEVLDPLRVLRANLDVGPGGRPHVIVVTSASPGDGKSTIAAELALATVVDGERVALVEADLRRPALERTVGGKGLVRAAVGLSNYVVAPHVTAADILTPQPELGNLHVAWAGPAPPTPTPLLAGERFAGLLAELRREYDRVIIDTSPVSVGADASLVASAADAVVFVIDVQGTSRFAAEAALDQLEHAHVAVAGIALNRVRVRRDAYYYRSPGAFGAANGGGSADPVAGPT
jgi:polysaccharide biosynthesis transport protein